MKLSSIAFLLIAALCLGATDVQGEDTRTLDVAVSPKWKVRMLAPLGWTLKSLPVTPQGFSQVMVESPAGMRMTLYVGSTAILEKKLAPPPGGTDDLVRDWTKAFPEKERSPLVEIKSESGLGAYVVITAAFAHIAAKPVYVKMAHGAFVIGDVILGFASDNIGDEKNAEFQQALKFIEEGITVL